MTTKQATELQAAIDRATEHGIEVVGHGHRKSDRARIYCTTSQSEANRWHIVALVGNRLTCDCHSRKLCSHRAAVHMELVVQLAERAARAEEIEDELEIEARDREEAEQQAERTRKREAAVLVRSNAPFSLFK
jgi:hypothetical protein